MEQETMPDDFLISIVVQGRNDSYMGNFDFRLATNINKFAQDIFKLNADKDVEIVLVDWGSEMPLTEVLKLTDKARSLLRVIQVSPEIAAKYNKDSPYSCVHPVNTGIRNARGEYILFCDGDTYAPLETMKSLLALIRNGFINGIPLREVFFMGSRYHIPKSFHVTSPSLEGIDQYIKENFNNLVHDKVDIVNFLGTATAYLFARDMMFECRGFDERYIYWGWWDIDLFHRLKTKYDAFDLEDFDMPFFHLEHYSDSLDRSLERENPRKMNPMVYPQSFVANDENWGLKKEKLETIYLKDSLGKTLQPQRFKKELPIHFFTIVLNGEPFIRYHLEVYKKLPFKWHWHIIEGVADLKHDTAWSVPGGGKVTDKLHRKGLSNDGTTDYLNELAKQYPENITIYRKQGNAFWDGKVEMINSPLKNIREDCLLWQVDVDEFWTVEQIEKMRSLFIRYPEKTAAYFYCYYFVGPRKYVVSVDTWGNRLRDWPRVWRFSSDMKWLSHEPQILVNPQGQDIKEINPFSRDETKAHNLIFQHSGYVIEPQLRFKEVYYGYPDVVSRWKELQETQGRVNLQEFLPWATDAIADDWPVSNDPVLANSLIDRFNRGKKVRIAGEDQSTRDLTKVDAGSDFATEIKKLFSKIRPKKIIETGTYLGTGTTAVIGSTLRQLSMKDTFFYTIEVNPEHYRQALSNLSKNGLADFVVPLNGLSVPRKLLPSYKEIENSYVKDIEFNGIFIDHKEHERALLYYQETKFDGVTEDLLSKCLRKFNYKPDFVLLDSAGHIGNIEFNYLIGLLKGVCYIALDDIYHIKHHKSFQQIQTDPRFELAVSSSEKFGFCIAKFTPQQEHVDSDIVAPNILWVRTDSIGDNILAASMLPHIKNNFKNSKITVVCQSHIAEIYTVCPFVDDIFPFNRNALQNDNYYQHSVLSQLQLLNPDLTLNSLYSRDMFSDFFAVSCNAKEKISLYGNLTNTSIDIVKQTNNLYTKLISSKGVRKLEIKRHRDFLKGLGIDAPSLQPLIWLTEEDEQFADNFFNEQGLNTEKTIALFAGAQHSVRLYEHYGIALSRICQKLGFTLIGLGSEHEYRFNEHNIRQAGVNGINFAGKSTIRQTAAIIKRCRLAVGAETGLAHIACVVGTPNVILLGGGHFGRFMPYSSLTSVVCLPLECYGCDWNCKSKRFHCVRDISPEMYAEAIRQTFEKPSEKPRIFVQGKSLWKPGVYEPEWEWSDKFIDPKTVEIITIDTIPEISQKERTFHAVHLKEKNINFKVSAIVSTYNSERFMRGCLEDLVNQTLYQKGELEIIVIDSGSDQNEKEIVEKFQKRHDNIIYMRTARESVYAAWNRGIKSASGIYITNANTDDRHRHDAFEVMAGVLDQRVDIGLVYADVIITETENETFERHTHAGVFRWLDFSRELLSLACFMGPQPMWRKSLHDRYGYFDDNFVSSGDWEFWLRIAEETEFLHIHELLGLYLRSPESVEHRNEQRAKEDIRILKTYVPRYLSTVEEIDKGLAAIRKVEHRDPGMLQFLKDQLLRQKSNILGKQYAPIDTAISEEDFLMPGDERGPTPQRKRIQGLTSIIILISDQREYPKKCVESVRKHTKEPYEIIFVPRNASYAPPKWLRKLLKENGNYRTLASPNPSSDRLSYAQACNLGIAGSEGEYILLLEDDAVVTGDWLSGLLECLGSGAETGIAGPMTVNVEGPQGVHRIEIGDSRSEIREETYINAFAKSFRERNRRRRISVRNLSGFCMLFRRELTEKIGVFDERFGSSEFAVDDFSIRASLEGYTSVIAGDVFVHRMRESAEKGFALKKMDKQAYIGKWRNIDESDPLRAKLVSVNTLAAADRMAQAGQVNNAVALLLEGMKQAPGDKKTDYALVELLIENKRFREGLDILENMPEEFRQDAQRLVLTGYCKEAFELFEEADDYADKALALNNALPKAWNLKGTIAFKKGMNAEAEECFQKSIESDRGFGEAYANLGALRWVAGEKEEALRLFEKAFILSPTVEDVVMNYYTAVVSLSQMERAEAFFKEALALHSFNRRLAFILTDLLLQREKYEEAMQALEKTMLTFGIDADTLSIALELREKVGAHKTATKETNRDSMEKHGDSWKAETRGDSVETHRDLRVQSPNLNQSQSVSGLHQSQSVSQSQVSISLCMIVKNEERNIGKCLMGIKPVVDEMIVVDTGSTDRTKDIAKAFGAKVFDFAWTDSFSDARNFSLSKASGDWILVLDADEVISPLDYEKFRRLIETRRYKETHRESIETLGDSSRLVETQSPNLNKSQPVSGLHQSQTVSSFKVAYSFVSRNYVVPVSINWHANDGKYREEAGSGWFPSEKVRLFPNIPAVRYEEPVHEMVERSLLRTGAVIKKSDVPIHHYGKLDKKVNREKGEEYYQLGKKKLAEQGEHDPHAIYEMAIQALELEKFDESLEYWEKMVGLQPDFAEAYHGMGMCCFKLGRYKDALLAFGKAKQLNPDSKDPVVLYATSALCAGDPETAIVQIEDLIRKEPDYPLALLALTVSCFCAGRKEKGLEYAGKVGNTGFALAPYMNDIAKLLIAAKLFDYAHRLLEAAVETNNVTDETRGLLEESYKMRRNISPPLRGGDKGKGEVIAEDHPHPNPPPSMGREFSPTLSLCMIVKNEEENIERALMSVKPVVDEMIVVDTGSIDRTKDIATALGAKVYDFPWTDDFSEARNFSLSKATGEWILILDADEVISPSDYEKLRELTHGDSSFIAYSFTTRNYVSLLGVGCFMNDGAYSREEAGSGWFPGDKVRLFPNDPRIRFENSVHELVEPSLQQAGIGCMKCEAVIHHYGKLNREKSLRKGEDYYNLGKRKFSEHGGKDLQSLYELAVQASELGKYGEALEFWKKLTTAQPRFPAAFHGMGTVYFRLGRYEDAISSLEKALQLDPGSADAIVLYSQCKICTGDAEAAVSLLEELLRKTPGYSMALFAVAAAYFCAGNKEKGLEYVKKLKAMNYTCDGYFNDSAKILISAQRPEYAVSLLEASMETGNVSDETRVLLSECNQLPGDSK